MPEHLFDDLNDAIGPNPDFKARLDARIAAKVDSLHEGHYADRKDGRPIMRKQRPHTKRRIPLVGFAAAMVLIILTAGLGAYIVLNYGQFAASDERVEPLPASSTPPATPPAPCDEGVTFLELPHVTATLAPSPSPTVTLPPLADGLSVQAVERDAEGPLSDRLEEEFPDTFDGLIVWKNPELRIILYYVGGEADQFEPVIGELDYRPVIDVREREVSVDEWSNFGGVINALDDAGLTIAGGIDDQDTGTYILYVANPALFRQQAEEAGIIIPESIRLVAAKPGFIPSTNKGYMLEGQTADCDPILMAVQHPTGWPQPGVGGRVSLDEQGCFRLNGRVGIAWPFGSQLRIDDNTIEVIYQGDIIARVGETVYGGGINFPEEEAIRYIEGYPAERCPGPVWFASGGTQPCDAVDPTWNTSCRDEGR